MLWTFYKVVLVVILVIRVRTHVLCMHVPTQDASLHSLVDRVVLPIALQVMFEPSFACCVLQVSHGDNSLSAACGSLAATTHSILKIVS